MDKIERDGGQRNTDPRSIDFDFISFPTHNAQYVPLSPRWQSLSTRMIVSTTREFSFLRLQYVYVHFMHFLDGSYSRAFALAAIFTTIIAFCTSYVFSETAAPQNCFEICAIIELQSSLYTYFKLSIFNQFKF